jgi:hypothetical protein
VNVSARMTCRALFLVSACTAASIPAAETTPARLYEIITETGMPHLEESLRYATTRENRCLTDEELVSAFSILKSASLADCKLRHERRDANIDSYLLVCEGGHGTTGNASWRVGEPLIVGQLDVKLGGKNMTFFQRVTAKPLGRCP